MVHFEDSVSDWKCKIFWHMCSTGMLFTVDESGVEVMATNMAADYNNECPLPWCCIFFKARLNDRI